MFFVLKSKFDRVKRWAEQTHDQFVDVTNRMMFLMLENHKLRIALGEIVANQTTHANATVKRMVKIAEDALEHKDEEGSPA